MICIFGANRIICLSAKQILIKTFAKFVQALRRKRILKIQRTVVLKSRCTYYNYVCIYYNYKYKLRFC